MDYQGFSVSSRADGKQYQCHFRMLVTAISLRHSDTVDVTFLVNAKPFVVAIPHVALAEFRNSTGLILTDAETIEMAGCFLKEMLEKEGLRDDRIAAVSREEALKLIASIKGPSRVDQPGVVGRLVTS
jgi:hypothetical protein